MKKKLSNLFSLMEDYFFRMLSKDILKLNNDIDVYFTGVSSENLNFLALREVPNDLDKILDLSFSFFKKHRCPWIIIIPEEIFSKEIEHSFFERSYQFQEKTQAMYHTLEQVYSIEDNMYKISNMNDNLDDWSLPLIEAFESDAHISKQYVEAHKHAKRKNANLQHFSIYHMNKPISSITLSIINSIARIDDLGTIPSLQNKGFATALLKHCLSLAKMQGASVCFLEGSSSAIKLYEKLDFKPLFTNLLFHYTKNNNME